MRREDIIKNAIDELERACDRLREIGEFSEEAITPDDELIVDMIISIDRLSELMQYIKCKNETEKIAAIKEYCENQMQECARRIAWYQAEKMSSLDYAEEIDELRTRNAHFEAIVKIIDADEFTSVMIY